MCPRFDSWWHHHNEIAVRGDSYLFMVYACYILYSKSANHYYIGYTSDIDERLKLHNNGHFGSKSYSFKATDWEIYLIIRCETIEQAVYVESRIKRMKSRKFIEDLRRYPELVEKILKEYKSKIR
jgi:putative endonuclease